MTKPLTPPPSKYKTYWCATGAHGFKGHGGYCPIVIKWLDKSWTCTCDCHTETDIHDRHEELLAEELGPVKSKSPFKSYVLGNGDGNITEFPMVDSLENFKPIMWVAGPYHGYFEPRDQLLCKLRGVLQVCVGNT